MPLDLAAFYEAIAILRRSMKVARRGYRTFKKDTSEFGYNRWYVAVELHTSTTIVGCDLLDAKDLRNNGLIWQDLKCTNNERFAPRSNAGRQQERLPASGQGD